RLLGAAGDGAGEQQRRHYAGARLAFGVRQDELPREAEAILHPAVALAEGVLVQRHQGLPALGELLPQPVEALASILLSRGVEVHDERDGGVGLELRPGVDGHEGLAAQLESQYVAVARGCRHAAERRAVREAGAREGGDVEIHGGTLVGVLMTVIGVGPRTLPNIPYPITIVLPH